MPETKQTLIRTGQWVQCRNEQPFLAVIKILPGQQGHYSAIDCPHCGRRYILTQEGDWQSDRAIKFVSIEELSDVQMRAIN